DLATVLMDDLANLLDRDFEYAVRRWIGHHQGAEGALVRFGLGLEIGDVDVAVLVSLDHDDLHPRHDRARRVSAVGRLRDQAGGAMRLAAMLVIRADDEQSRKLSLRSGIRL